MMEMNKGVYKNKKGNWIAQYWNKEFKKVFYIGQYDSKEEAIQGRQKYLSEIYDGVVIEKIKEYKYPKGIRPTSDGKKFMPSISIFKAGPIKDTHLTLCLTVCDTIEEAVELRKNFILKLL